MARDKCSNCCRPTEWPPPLVGIQGLFTTPKRFNLWAQQHSKYLLISLIRKVDGEM